MAPGFGDSLELAIWLDGTETAEMLADYRNNVAPLAFRKMASEHGLLTAPPTFSLLKPGDERVPQVPAWLERRIMEKGRRPVAAGGVEAPADQAQAPLLLVAHARIVARLPDFSARSFLADLDQDALNRLRAVTKRKWLEANPTAMELTDAEADKLIEEHGPDAARRAVLRSMN